MRETVVYLEEGRGFGGSTAVLAHTLPSLRELGYRLSVVLANNDPRAVRALREVGLTVHVMPYTRRSREIMERMQQLEQGLRLLKRGYVARQVLWDLVTRLPWMGRLRRLLRQSKADILHCNNGPESNWPALLLAKAMGLKTVVSVRGYRGRRTAWGRLAERCSNWEIFVSDWVRRASLAERRNVSVIYDGLDERHWRRPNSQCQRPDVIRFAHVGMLTSWKGQDVFLKAAAALAREAPNAEFLLFGKVIDECDRPYARTLREIADRSPRPERIRFMGFRQDLREALASVDVLVHSSTEPEPYGLVVLEGMASGLAIIASNAGGPTEILRDGVDGLLVEPGSPESLAEAMLALARAPERIRALGREARASFERKFTAQHAAESLHRIYQQLVRS